MTIKKGFNHHLQNMTIEDANLNHLRSSAIQFWKGVSNIFLEKLSMSTIINNYWWLKFNCYQYNILIASNQKRFWLSNCGWLKNFGWLTYGGQKWVSVAIQEGLIIGWWLKLFSITTRLVIENFQLLTIEFWKGHAISFLKALDRCFFCN